MSISETLDAQILNHQEAELLNAHFEEKRGEFDFTNKKVGFFLSTTVWTKEEFFNDLINRNSENLTMSNQFIILNQDQKNESGGYDVFVYSWSKLLINPKQVNGHINRIKKNDAQQK